MEKPASGVTAAMEVRASTRAEAAPTKICGTACVAVTLMALHGGPRAGV